MLAVWHHAHTNQCSSWLPARAPDEGRGHALAQHPKLDARRHEGGDERGVCCQALGVELAGGWARAAHRHHRCRAAVAAAGCGSAGGAAGWL